MKVRSPPLPASKRRRVSVICAAGEPPFSTHDVVDHAGPLILWSHCHSSPAGGRLGPPEALLGYRVQTLSARKAYVGTVRDVCARPML